MYPIGWISHQQRVARATHRSDPKPVSPAMNSEVPNTTRTRGNPPATPLGDHNDLPRPDKPFLAIEGDICRAVEHDHHHISLRVHVLFRPGPGRPRKQGRVELVGRRSPSRPARPVRQQFGKALSGHDLLDRREEHALLHPDVSFEELTERLIGTPRMRTDALMLEKCLLELRRVRSDLGQEGKDKLFLLAEVTDEINGKELGKPFDLALPKTSSRNEPVMVVMRQRDKRWMTLHRRIPPTHACRTTTAASTRSRCAGSTSPPPREVRVSHSLHHAMMELDSTLGAMNANRDGQVRYLVHFSEGGAAMRWRDDPLKEATFMTEQDVGYIVVRVEQPKVPNGLGHAWVELA